MIPKLCVMNTWVTITKAMFQNSLVLSFFFLITFLSSLLLILSKAYERQLRPQFFNSSLEIKQYFHLKFCQIKSVRDCSYENSFSVFLPLNHGKDIISLHSHTKHRIHRRDLFWWAVRSESFARKFCCI